jgi:hypothetical protein
MTLDHVLVVVEHFHEVSAHLFGSAAGSHQMLTTRQFGGFAKHQCGTQAIKFVKGIAHGRVGAASRCGVRFTAFGRNPEVRNRALHAVQAGGVLHHLLGRLGSTHDGVMVAVAFDAKTHNRLACGRNAVDHGFGPAVFNANHHHRCHVRVGACANQGAKVQFEVGTKLQTTIRVWNGHGALDGVGHSFCRCVRQVVQRQDDDVVTNADTAVLTAVAPESGVFVNDGHEINLEKDKWAISAELPALGFDVVDMGVVANGDGCNHFANVCAVFHDRVTDGHRFHGHFVSDGDSRIGLDRDGAVVVQDEGIQALTGFDAFNDDNSDAVFFFMQYAMDHKILLEWLGWVGTWIA